MGKKLILFLATGFHVGDRFPAPGTAGTVVAIPLVYGASFLDPIAYMGLCLLAIFGAIFLAEAYERLTGQHDAKQIVIDEIVGYMVAVTWLPWTWQTVLLSFVLFRFFDILKPFPISYIDRELKGGLGVVMDDVLAGVVVNILLQVIYVQTAWLGVQWGQ